MGREPRHKGRHDQLVDAREAAPPARQKRARPQLHALLSCRRCRISCYEWELQMSLCPDCALEHVMNQMPACSTSRQMSAAAAAAAAAAATTSSELSKLPRKQARRPRPPPPHFDADGEGGEAGAGRAGGGGSARRVKIRQSHGGGSGGWQANETGGAMAMVGHASAAPDWENEDWMGGGGPTTPGGGEDIDWGPGPVTVTNFAADVLKQLRCSVCLGYLDPNPTPDPTPDPTPNPTPKPKLSPKPSP